MYLMFHHYDVIALSISARNRQVDHRSCSHQLQRRSRIHTLFIDVCGSHTLRYHAFGMSKERLINFHQDFFVWNYCHQFDSFGNHCTRNIRPIKHFILSCSLPNGRSYGPSDCANFYNNRPRSLLDEFKFWAHCRCLWHRILSAPGFRVHCKKEQSSGE